MYLVFKGLFYKSDKVSKVFIIGFGFIFGSSGGIIIIKCKY